MKDSYGRNIDYLRISVTDKCNLNCFYCMPESKETTALLTDDEILEVIKSAVNQGITKIRLTGGEPLVRKGIYQLIKKIKEIEKIKELTLTTNGILLQGNVKKLKEYGVNRINLSLDSLHPKFYKDITKYNEEVDFDTLIEEILDEGLVPLKINVVLLKGLNDHQINSFIEYAAKFDVVVRFIELMDIGELDFDYQKYYISKDEILRKFPLLKLEKVDGNTTYYKHPNKEGLIGFINPVSKKFCNNCNRLRLTADGKIRPCLHFDEEFRIKDLDYLEIENIIKNAILNKPKEHELDLVNGARSKKAMNKIGG